MKWLKRLIVAVVVIFALFYLVTRPHDAADAVTAAGTTVWHGIQSVGVFFSSLAD